MNDLKKVYAGMLYLSPVQELIQYPEFPQLNQSIFYQKHRKKRRMQK